MTAMLRHLRLGDGALARFNGMGATERDALATVLAYDEGRASPAGDARSLRLCAPAARRVPSCSSMPAPRRRWSWPAPPAPAACPSS